MNSVVSKMTTLKGEGVGRRAVMGRLKSVKGMKRSFSAHPEVADSSEWSKFSRAVGIAISCIEESAEYMQSVFSSELETLFLSMLEIVRSRELLCEIKDMIDVGIGAELAVEHFGGENKGEMAAEEVSLLLMRILRGGAEFFSLGGEIAVCDYELDVTALIALAHEEIFGAVCVGKKNSARERLCELIGISVLFVGAEDILSCPDGESAVLYPDKDVIFISPEIEVVSDYTSKINGEDGGVIFASFCGEEVLSVFDCSRGRFCGFLIDSVFEQRDEDKLFEFYRRISESFGDSRVIVCIGGDDEERKKEILRAACRAAVYGKVSASVSVRSPEGYRAELVRFDDVCAELESEGREFEDDLKIGATIDSVGGLLFAREIGHISDMLVIRSDWICTDEGSISERVAIKSVFFEKILACVPKDNNVLIEGSLEETRNIIDKISADESEKERILLFAPRGKK